MKKLTIFIIGGVAVLVIILGLLGFFVVGPLITEASSPTPTPTPAVTASPSATAKKSNPVTAVLKTNAAAIQSQIASDLHLTASQLQQDIKSGQTLSQIATAQNVSATQLQTDEANVVKPYLDQAVSAGSVTQKQEDNFLKRLQTNPDTLDTLLKVKPAS
jgi:hypothetical protein